MMEKTRTGSFWFELDVVSALDDPGSDAALLVGRKAEVAAILKEAGIEQL